ncbi:hypothetical protein L228DRAFT_232583 [Xylona heveae TC161]|uniref:tRNA(Phe) 7-[(3-amino-3-carboxypropyl)-4-demethylwyosine(37)-N(4)]-methyltransferase n=1 Tax=Xylona heveae (strain CBS 132557 / TC161) TaxID=1328760 RepID=A0A165FG43_XYLHT|nr:hypothetical protein L228DRAFT_232583 [Xylona heveae TC161]KZF20936.1 hypothetical protein L228DRAFT_232583 [Xylona heveae TC161]
MENLPEAPPSFVRKKQTILHQLAVPTSQYSDLSPKGSVDEAIRTLIDGINSSEGLVTTSSCAGRVSVFLEGVRRQGTKSEATLSSEVNNGQLAGPGGKGGGGRWLFVSHDPIVIPNAVDSESFIHNLFQLPSKPTSHFTCPENCRYLHFKFEPMILHVLTSSLKEAQKVLNAALQAGFRESGAMSLEGAESMSTTPMVAVRSIGLMFDSIIGFATNDDGAEHIRVTVSDEHLRMLVDLANERFRINQERIQRFRTLLLSPNSENRKNSKKAQKCTGETWEEPEVRRARKKAEGERKRKEHQTKQAPNPASNEEDSESLEYIGNMLE